MRKIFYSAIAIFLILALYIIIMKTAPDKIPANSGTGYSENPFPSCAIEKPWFSFLPFSNATEASSISETFRSLQEDQGELFQWLQVPSSESTTSPYLFIGTFPGDLSYDEAESILTEIFTDLEVESIQKMQDQNVISWGGYSPKIPLFLRDLTGGPINIQGALRYNSIEDLTYFYLGSPLIYIEY